MAYKYLTDEENARLDFLSNRMTLYRRQLEIDEAEKDHLESLIKFRAKEFEFEKDNK